MTFASAHTQPQTPPHEAGGAHASALTPLDRILRRELVRQLRVAEADLDHLQMRRSYSQFLDALMDIEVFDSDGRLVYEGREFRGMTALWTPTSIARPASELHDIVHRYAPPHLRFL